VTTTKRSELLPDISTIGEFVADYELNSWRGIGAPRNTPADVVDKLNNEINAGGADPKVKARLAETGYAPMPRGMSSTSGCDPRIVTGCGPPVPTE
jgi:tripartite-type tricarboxylate transporter receptor subunit TctC